MKTNGFMAQGSSSRASGTQPLTDIFVVFPGNKSVKDDIDIFFERVRQRSDYRSFEQLFLRLFSPLCHFSQKYVAVKEVAEELVSDVFFTIWVNRSQLIVNSPRAYLYSAVRNRSIDYLRKIKGSVLCDLEEASGFPSDVTDSHEKLVEAELTQHIDRSISGLPKQCKLIFELSRDHGMKYKDIAAMLNVSIKTVETQMGRALKQLRKSLQPIESA